MCLKESSFMSVSPASVLGHSNNPPLFDVGTNGTTFAAR